MKTGLNLFVGQLITIISLLVLISLGLFVSFYYSNSKVLSNYDTLMLEEREKNKLNHVDMLISLARQAEQSFYVEQKIENAQLVLNNISNASIILRELYINETGPEDNSPDQKKFSLKLQKISQQVNTYQQLFSQSLNLWKIRGLSRDSGIGLQLRKNAYNGLRSKLILYNTQGLLGLINELRWLEYEYYLYGGKYLSKMQYVIKQFKQKLIDAKLSPKLSKAINQKINNYQQELNKADSLKTKKEKHPYLEKQAYELLSLLTEYTIDNFSLLYRTLLYYEMEYRELGHQIRHVEGIISTIKIFKQAIETSSIDSKDKNNLLVTLKNYSLAFNRLVQVDQKIAGFKEKIDTIFLQITPIINSAIKYEAKVMENIQQQTNEDNQKNTTINIFTAFITLILFIIVIVWMIKRMGGKVGQIGHNLELIANGNFNIISHIPQQSKRDELDWISYHVEMVAKNLSISIQSLQTQNKDLEIISNKLSKYLSPQIHQSIFSGNQLVNIQSKRKRLTIFFSDIVGFTHATEMMESEELTNLLNDYLNEMSKIALEYGGTIDKFIGDAMMIFFGDPETKGDKEDCLACVSMAIEMRKRLNELQQIWEQDKGYTQPFKIRIGIATGYCTVGNFGSEQRMDYTIIGGNVNLASRLEQSAKPDQILIAHETYALIKDKIDCIQQETIQLKGISQAIRTYQVNNLFTEKDANELHIQVQGNGYQLSIDSTLIANDERKNLAEHLLKVAKKLS